MVPDIQGQYQDIVSRTDQSVAINVARKYTENSMLLDH